MLSLSLTQVHIETCLCISVLILTSLLFKKPSIWMLELSIHWVGYKARLMRNTDFKMKCTIHHVIIL